MNCKSRFFLNLHYTAYVLVLTFLDICIRGLKIFSALIHTVKTKKSCSKDAECLKQLIFKFNKPELENLGLFFVLLKIYTITSPALHRCTGFVTWNILTSQGMWSKDSKILVKGTRINQILQVDAGVSDMLKAAARSSTAFK